MPIPQSTIDAIRDKVDITDVVGVYVDLKRAGTNFKGLCPFHSEKTPSFVVSPDKQIYHCFGCDQGGNVFKFVMEMEGINFPEAVRVLGEKCGIQVEDQRIPDEERSRNDAFFEANRFAARFYHQQLVKNPAAEIARTYLKNRDIPESAWRHFGLGYAPPEWDSLLRAATRAGIRRDTMTEVRLIVARERTSGYYDYFRDRIMFPIIAAGGRVLAFGARAMGDDEPKYLNSAETPIFSKRKTFYGLDRARDAIRKRREAIVVEGYTDLISLHLAGLENTVAQCGTALTPEHANALRRITQRVIILPDGDSAGEKAALAAGAVLIAAGLDVNVGQLDPGQDPDTFVRKHGGDVLTQLIDKSMDYFTHLQYVIKQRQMSAREQETLIRRIVAGVSTVDDGLRYDVIIKELARILVVDPASLRAATRARRAGATEKVSPAASHDPGRSIVERLALRLILEGTTTAIEALDVLDEDDFTDEGSRKLYNLLDYARESRIDIRGRDFQVHAEEAGLEQLAAEIALISVPPGNIETLLKDTIRRIKKLKISDELSELRERLQELPPDGEEAVAIAEYYHKLKQALVDL